MAAQWQRSMLLGTQQNVRGPLQQLGQGTVVKVDGDRHSQNVAICKGTLQTNGSCAIFPGGICYKMEFCNNSHIIASW